jgi:hypothetical protein
MEPTWEAYQRWTTDYREGVRKCLRQSRVYAYSKELLEVSLARFVVGERGAGGEEPYLRRIGREAQAVQ